MRRPPAPTRDWPVRASTMGPGSLIGLRYRNPHRAGQHAHLERKAAEWLAVQVDARLGVALDAQGPGPHDLDLRVVNVACLVDPRQLAERLQARQVGDAADVQPAVV